MIKKRYEIINWQGGGKSMRLWSFCKYVILCARLGYFEHHGHIDKHEADRICLNFLDEL